MSKRLYDGALLDDASRPVDAHVTNSHRADTIGNRADVSRCKQHSLYQDRMPLSRQFTIWREQTSHAHAHEERVQANIFISNQKICAAAAHIFFQRNDFSTEFLAVRSSEKNSWVIS